MKFQSDRIEHIHQSIEIKVSKEEKGFVTKFTNQLSQLNEETVGLKIVQQGLGKTTYNSLNYSQINFGNKP